MTPPSTWAAPDFAANAANALALRARLEALAGTGIMRTAEQGTSTALLSELNAVLNAETPSLASVVTPAFLPVITDSFEEFAEVAAAGPVASLIDGGGQWAPGAAGGITGGTGARGINEGGIEVRQIVHKGLFTGGAFYSEAVRLTTGTINEATIDSIAALWGGNPTLDVDDTDGIGPETITVTEALAGRYTVGVHVFGGSSGVGVKCNVKVFINSSLRAEYEKTLPNNRDFWTVADIMVPSSLVNEVDTVTTLP